MLEMKAKHRAIFLVLVISVLFVNPALAQDENKAEGKKNIYDTCTIVDSPTEMGNNPILFKDTAVCVFSDPIAVKTIFLYIMLIYLFFEPIFMDLVIESPIILGFDLLGILVSIIASVFLWTLGPLRYALIYLTASGTGIYITLAVLLVFTNVIRTRQKRAEMAQQEPSLR